MILNESNCIMYNIMPKQPTIVTASEAKKTPDLVPQMYDAIIRHDFHNAGFGNKELKDTELPGREWQNCMANPH